MDPLTLATGAGLLAAGWLAGHLSGWAAARRRVDKPPEPVCGCTHHRAHHDPQTLECSASVEVRLYDRDNYPAGTKWFPCPCRQYVGPEPISSLWTPPVLPEGDGRT